MFWPWLMPLSTKSGRSGMSASIASMTQSVGPMAIILGCWALTNFVARPMVFGTGNKIAGFFLGTVAQGAALGFSHGLSVRFGFVTPRADLDVFLLAPKGPGTALRSLYTEGKGMIAVWAVAIEDDPLR